MLSKKIDPDLFTDELRECICGDPENCREPVPGYVCRGANVIPSDPVVVFLNRWAFNWRGERAVIEKELRELIAAVRTEA